MTDPLFVDLYAGDLNGHPDWQTLAHYGPPWHGAIIKATEGTHYTPQWFDVNWRELWNVSCARYGKDWFRGCYHFLKFNEDGKAQADLYLATVQRAGGWDHGDLFPIVDVELGDAGNSNQSASSQQIIDCTSAFAHRCTQVTGRPVILYGNGAMRDKGIKDRMGCEYLWLPRYTASLPVNIYERAGWSVDRLLMWQYCGDGVSALPGYPSQAPGLGRVDLSALTVKGGVDWLRTHLT